MDTSVKHEPAGPYYTNKPGKSCLHKDAYSHGIIFSAKLAKVGVLKTSNFCYNEILIVETVPLLLFPKIWFRNRD